MTFIELENIMHSRGISSLAEIARALNTTPQAVSNWKARDQIPHHIVATLNKIPIVDSLESSGFSGISSPKVNINSQQYVEENTLSISDILLTLAEQLKVIILTTFVSVFLTFTYVQFIKTPLYVSWATVLLPENKIGNLGGLAGLASQFGVNIPMESSADLSSPSLYPELLGSRTFAEKIFFTNSGAESVECAIKMARKYFYEKGFKKKNRIITLKGSFHGRTLGTIAAAGDKKLTNGFGPVLRGFDQVTAGDLTELQDCINERTAAILIEPIQGEGGIQIPNDDYLSQLRQICNDNYRMNIFTCQNISKIILLLKIFTNLYL